MKAYLSGKISRVAMVATLVAWIELTDGFFHSYPVLFWLVQMIFVFILVFKIVFTLIHWDNSYRLSRKRMLLSLLNILALYGIAWTCSEYSWFLILLCGTAEVYFLRKHLEKLDNDCCV